MKCRNHSTIAVATIFAISNTPFFTIVLLMNTPYEILQEYSDKVVLKDVMERHGVANIVQ